MKKKILLFIVAIFFIMTVPSFAIVEGTNRTIKVNSKVYDELDSYDEVDYFDFKLSKPGSIKIDFEFDIKGEYNVKLINVTDDKVVQKLTFKSEVNTTNGRYEMSGGKVRLNSGKYRLEVSTARTKHCDEEYELKLNYDSESSANYEKEDNNTAKTSMIIDYNRKITGNLESKLDVDFYMVELDKPGTLQIKLQHDKSAKYNVTLYSENNGKLNQLQNSKFNTELVPSLDYTIDMTDKIRVPEGNYYIKISGTLLSFNNDEDYGLTVLYSADRYGNYEEENNNSTSTATFMYESDKFIGNLSSKFDVDYYYINLYGNKYYANMEVPQGAKYNLVLYKEENGKLNQVSSNIIDSNDRYIELKNCNGTYYIKIVGKTYSNEDYTIKVLRENEVRIPKTLEFKVDSEYMLVNGEDVLIDENRGTKPVIINGRMLLPASAIVENLGGKVNWNNASRISTFELGDRIITMPIESTTAYVNGQVKQLDVPTTIINSRTMVPVRFVAENLGCNVTWTEGTVVIKY